MERKMFTVAQTAERLGLSQMTVRNWIARRRIAHVRLGRAIRIPDSSIIELINRGTVPAAQTEPAAAVAVQVER